MNKILFFAAPLIILYLNVIIILEGKAIVNLDKRVSMLENINEISKCD